MYMYRLRNIYSYAWLLRKCNYRTDRQKHEQTDAEQSDPYVLLCFEGDTKTLKIGYFDVIVV